jgi:cell division septation protein DedD
LGYTNFFAGEQRRRRSYWVPWQLILLGLIPIVDVQAKDRLTGAVILVVLLVLVVPELLSGPEHKVAAVATPRSDDPPMRSYTVDLADEARNRHAPSSAAAPATPPPATAPVVVATAPPVAPTPPAAVPPVQQTARAGAAVAHPVAPEPAPAGAGWTVQLGTFASRANAERLVRDLKSQGFAAFLTESGSGGRELYRVRVGPAGARAAAEALGAKLRAAGHTGTLTQRP